MMKESICSVYRKFNMNRVLKEYVNNLYIPARNCYEELCNNNFQKLREATRQEQEVTKRWPNIKFLDFSTNVDKRDYLLESDSLQVQCTLDLGQGPTELFSVELCYIYDSSSGFKTIPMELRDNKGTLAHYECSRAIEGYGVQQINVRIKPANETIQDLHPELVKWAQ
jgi:glucan phosphorylase